MSQVDNRLPNLLLLRRRCTLVRRGGGGQVGQQLQASLACASRHIEGKVHTLCHALQWCPRMGTAGFLAKLLGLSRGCAWNLASKDAVIVLKDSSSQSTNCCHPPASNSMSDSISERDEWNCQRNKCPKQEFQTQQKCNFGIGGVEVPTPVFARYGLVMHFLEIQKNSLCKASLRGDEN